jgi:hypothetical protein
MVSGKDYGCESNPIGIETLRMEFNSTEKAIIYVKISGNDYILPVGLNGHYQLSSYGAGHRGCWKDEQTFLYEEFTIGVVTHTIVFEGDRMQINFPEIGLTINCQVQNP